MRSPLVNVRTWLAVSVYMVIVQAFVALTDGVGPHTRERRFKCRHNFSHTLYIAGHATDAPGCRGIRLTLNLGGTKLGQNVQKASHARGRAVRRTSHGGARRILAERALFLHSSDLSRCSSAVIRRQIIHPRAQERHLSPQRALCA